MNDIWKDKLAFYDKLIANHVKFERKGKTMPYTSVNGHMFSLLNKDGEIGIRLSKEAGKRFMEKYHTTPFKSHGCYMRGYVLVPENLYNDLALLTQYLDEAYEYVLSLEPK